MKITIWGPRGSIPSPIKPEQIEEKIVQAILNLPKIDTSDPIAVRTYVSSLPLLQRRTAGGNTSCVQIETKGEMIVIDAGSGLLELSRKLMQGEFGQGRGRLHLLFSHPHWDHIQGFPFFAPRSVAGNEINIYSIHDLHRVLHDQQNPRNFPVQLENAAATLNFNPLEVGRPFKIGKVRINTIENPHPGRAFSFRFEDEHCVFVYASDTEFKTLNDASVQAHIDFFRNADALIFDAQYTLKESWQKEDWGHSSALIGVDLARAAGVKQLVLFHHDPSYSDTQLEEILNTALAYQAQDTSLPACEIVVAYEGMTLNLTPPGAVELRLMPEHAATVVTPTSVFDERGIDQLAQQLARLAEQGKPSDSIIDLSQVETLTTASLKMLVSLGEGSASGSIVLASPSESVLSVIKLAGYLDFFALYPTVEQAVAALQTRKALNLPGQLIAGRYLIEEQIGSSLLGTVLKALDLEHQRQVAIKVLSPALKPATVDRFMRQVRRLVGLDQASIVRVFEVGTEQDYVYIVEEFVESPTLQQLLADRSVLLPVDEALDLGVDLTVALEFLHSRGVTHGNLKPENIFLTGNGVKLGGIGLGRLEEGRNLLEVPLLHLTAAYLAPEQILGQPLDARTDLYALGIILYRLFTGQLPYQGTEAEIMEAHLYASPIPPREFNPEITPSLEHLVLKLLVNNPSARYASAEQVRRVLSSLIVSSGDAKFPRKVLPLVDRGRQLQTLHLCWQQVLGGQGQLIFLTGEAGIGKTVLTQQFAAEIEPPILLFGHCQKQGSPTYLLFTEALRTYFATVPPELFDDDARKLISNFTRLVPEIHQILPDLPVVATLDPKQEQLRLMSNVTEFIKRATRERPWLLILEDLQWADTSSLELLRYLSYHLEQLPLMIIGTYRDDPVERRQPLLESLREINRYSTFPTLNLARLDSSGVAKVLCGVWKQSPPPALVDKIHEQTDGNPYFVEEVAKALLDDGLIIAQDGQWHFPNLDEVRLPKSVREAVWQRIHYLSPDTQALLRQAAVLGQTFRFGDLRAMSGLSEWELLEHLDVALEQELLWETPSSGDSLLTFGHVEVQRVLYDDMGPLRRRKLHRQAGEALERRLLPDPGSAAEELAYHFKEADEVEKGLVYAIQAARRAQADYANDTAVHWFDTTLEMLDQLDPEKSTSFQQMRLSVHRFCGEVLTRTGRYDQALDHYAAARKLVEAAGKSHEQGRQMAALCAATAEVLEKRSEYDTAFRWIDRGLSYLNSDQATDEAAGLYLIGAQAYDHQGKLDLAIDWCQKSLVIASPLETRESQQTMAKAYTRLSAICLVRGYLDLVIHFCQESIGIYEQIDDTVNQVGPYRNLGAAHFDLGNWRKAQEAYTKSMAIAQMIGDVDGFGRATNLLANLFLNQGKWAEALDLLYQNQETWRQIGMARDEAVTTNHMAQVYIYQQDWVKAQECLTRSQAIIEGVGAADYLPALERRWGEFWLGTGEQDKALEHVRRSVELAKSQTTPLEEGKSYRMLGQVYLAQGKTQQAEQALAHSLKVLTNYYIPYEAARTRMLLARVALATGNQNHANHYLDEAQKIFESLHSEFNLAEVRKLIKQLDSQPAAQVKD